MELSIGVPEGKVYLVLLLGVVLTILEEIFRLYARVGNSRTVTNGLSTPGAIGGRGHSRLVGYHGVGHGVASIAVYKGCRSTRVQKRTTHTGVNATTSATGLCGNAS